MTLQTDVEGEFVLSYSCPSPSPSLSPCLLLYLSPSLFSSLYLF